MSTEVKFRRGSTTQHATFTGAFGEVTVDTDLNTLRIHDGATVGGHRILLHSEFVATGAGTVTEIDTGIGANWRTNYFIRYIGIRFCYTNNPYKFTNCL